MKTEIIIENLKCHGCENTIKRNILALPEVTNVEIIHETSTVKIEYNGNIERHDEFSVVLKKLGYPEIGENSTGATIKSYVSCAIGRIKK